MQIIEGVSVIILVRLICPSSNLFLVVTGSPEGPSGPRGPAGPRGPGISFGFKSCGTLQYRIFAKLWTSKMLQLHWLVTRRGEGYSSGTWTKYSGFGQLLVNWTKSLGFGTKSLGPWTNPCVWDKIEIILFKLMGGYRLKIENLTSLSSVKVPQEPEYIFYL